MKILIIGAGIGGLALAKRLDDTQVDVTIIDKQPSQPTTGTGICLPSNAVDGMTKLGLYAELMDKAHVVSSVEYAKSDGETLAKASLLEAPLNKGEFVALLRTDLLDILIHALKCPIHWDTQAHIIEQHDNGVSVSLTGQKNTLHFDMVVAADGIHSATRQSVMPDHSTLKLGMSNWRFVVNNTRATPEPVYYMGNDEAFMIYPLPNDQAYCYGQVSTDKVRTSGQATSREALLQAFSKYNHTVLHKIHQLSEDNTQVIKGELESVQLTQASVGRVVFIGDALHGCPPTLQQGVGMSLEDIHLLADLLLKDESIETTLKQFSDARLPRVKWVIDESNRIIRMAAKGSGLIGRLLRNAMIRRKGPANVAGWRKLLYGV